MSNNSKFEPFRLGVLGAGKISQIVLPMLASRGISVTSLFDVNTEAAQALAAKLGGTATVYTDAASLLASSEIDGVYLATPPSLHRTQVLDAINAGRHVICEKPWMLNAEEARAILNDIQARSSRVIVGACTSRFRFNPAVNTASEAVAQGRIGRLRQVRINATTTPPAPLDALPAWKRHASSAGGGLAADWCVYELDWLAAVVGSEFDPVEVTTTLDFWRREGTDIDSGYNVHFRCASGLDVRLSRRSEIGPRQHRVEIRGENGGIDLPFAPDDADNVARLHRFAPDGKTLETTELSPPVTDWGAILAGPIENFAAAVRGKGPVASTPASQIKVHVLLDALYASGREGRPVTITL